ncbi:lachesin-like [Babylonia areolata]|uniref:lachesin-like n=1 Tax=Babylonia areolata TaxID=304850 RepID=UPI003FD30C82
MTMMVMVSERMRLTEQIYETQGVNVTVIEGKTAILPCSVHDAPASSDSKPVKVVWTDQWSTILTFRDERIIDDERIHVDHTFAREWNLRLERVKYGDQGIYTCQVNTDPVISYTVHLTVVVPPRLTNDVTAGSVEVLEGNRAELVCNATGIPTPTITWFRQTARPSSTSQLLRIGETGQVLVIHNVTRHCKGVYLCVAENGVPPSVRREIRVQVKFKPEVKLPTKRISQVRGKDTILECVVSAHPQAQAMWRFHGRQLNSNDKYNVNIYPQLGTDTITLSLYIRRLEPSDFGKYNCIASNSLGETSQKMVLSEHIIRTTTTTTPSTTTTTTSSASSPTTTRSLLYHPSPPSRLAPQSRGKGKGKSSGGGGPHADRRVHAGGGGGGGKGKGGAMEPAQTVDANSHWEPGANYAGADSGARAGRVSGCCSILHTFMLILMTTSVTVVAHVLLLTS